MAVRADQHRGRSVAIELGADRLGEATQLGRIERHRPTAVQRRRTAAYQPRTCAQYIVEPLPGLVHRRMAPLARGDDFIGMQNYERARVGETGDLPPPPDAPKSTRGTEIYSASLAGTVRYGWDVTKVPVLVTEHGIGTDDDRQRASFIPAALAHLKAAMDDGVPVLGYIHWSLLDNFDGVFGYGPKFGLVAVDRATFKRTPKPSAGVLAAIAKRHAA